MNNNLISSKLSQKINDQLRQHNKIFNGKYLYNRDTVRINHDKNIAGDFEMNDKINMKKSILDEDYDNLNGSSNILSMIMNNPHKCIHDDDFIRSMVRYYKFKIRMDKFIIKEANKL